MSIHLRFGLPFLLPSTSILVTLSPTHSSSILTTCPYHFLTSVVPLILSFLILSIFLRSQIQLNILISATSNFFSSAFFAAYVSARTPLSVLQTSCIHFPWPSSWILCNTEPLIRSCNVSIRTLLNELFPRTGRYRSPSSATVDPRYSKSSHSVQFLSLQIYVWVLITITYTY